LALVVVAARLLDECSPEDDPGHPDEHNRNSEPEGRACGPAPGNRHRDPQGEHHSDDRSTPPHSPWTSVLTRFASPVESQTSRPRWAATVTERLAPTLHVPSSRRQGRETANRTRCRRMREVRRDRRSRSRHSPDTPQADGERSSVTRSRPRTTVLSLGLTVSTSLKGKARRRFRSKPRRRTTISSGWSACCS
jgi:hypothetical protein